MHYLAAVLAILTSSYLVALAAEACDSQPCQNGGSCVQNSAGNFSCQCQLGYKGNLCEQVWLTEMEFKDMKNSIKFLTSLATRSKAAQVIQKGEIIKLKNRLDQYDRTRNAINGPRYFIPWTSFHASAKIIDSSLLRVGNRLIIATLTAASQLQIFQLVSVSVFIEIQSLTLSHARGISSFRVGMQSCIAVARSQNLPVSLAHTAKTVVYCWSDSSNTFVKKQELTTRGARHMEFVTIGRSSFLVVSCSGRWEAFNSRTYVYLWFNQSQRFLLYQYLPTTGAVRSKAISTPHAMYLTVHEENEQLHTTKLFRWNGTYFDQLQTSFDAGFVFSMGHIIYKIVNSSIYRLHVNSRQFDFHSTLPDQNNTSSVHSSFLVSGSFYLAGRVDKNTGQGSLFVHKMNGFDFTPYQTIPVLSGSFATKILSLQKNDALMAIMQDKTLKLLNWTHM